MKIKNNKKGIELTLQTIVVMIIVIIVLVVMIFFFSNHFGGNSDVFFNASNSAVSDASNSINI